MKNAVAKRSRIERTVRLRNYAEELRVIADEMVGADTSAALLRAAYDQMAESLERTSAR